MARGRPIGARESNCVEIEKPRNRELEKENTRNRELENEKTRM